MTVKRYLISASLAGLAAASLTGTALADSTVDTQTTGPDSVQNTTITNVNTVTTTNNNTVSVVNVNDQSSKTGSVLASGNTSVQGELASGNAANTANTETVVTLNNVAPGRGAGNPGVGPVGGGNGGGNVNVPGAPGGGNVTVPGKGGGVLGAVAPGKGGGASMLPTVGASVPMDVSALRALYQPKTDAPTSHLAKQSSGLSVLLLIVASILSLMGAVGSAIYAQRKQQLKV